MCVAHLFWSRGVAPVRCGQDLGIDWRELMQIATVRTGFPFANIYLRTNCGIGGEYLKAGDVDDCGGSYGCKSEVLFGSCGRNVRFLGWVSLCLAVNRLREPSAGNEGNCIGKHLFPCLALSFTRPCRQNWVSHVSQGCDALSGVRQSGQDCFLIEEKRHPKN